MKLMTCLPNNSMVLLFYELNVHRILSENGINDLFVAHHLLLLALHLLFRQLLFGFIVGNFSNNFFLFGQNNLNVTRWAHVWIDSTVSTVCTTAKMWSTVYLRRISDVFISISREHFIFTLLLLNIFKILPVLFTNSCKHGKKCN